MNWMHSELWDGQYSLGSGTECYDLNVNCFLYGDLVSSWWYCLEGCRRVRRWRLEEVCHQEKALSFSGLTLLSGLLRCEQASASCPQPWNHPLLCTPYHDGTMAPTYHEPKLRSCWRIYHLSIWEAGTGGLPRVWGQPWLLSKSQAI